MSILLKRNNNPGVAPLAEELVPGEIAINTADATLYTKNENGEVIPLASASDLPIPTTIPWENITGKPEFNFNNIPPEDIIGTAVIDSDPRLTDARDPLPHNHNIASIDGLQDELDNKSNLGHIHDGRYYTKTQSNDLLDDKANITHTHIQSEIIGLSGTLDTLQYDIYSTLNPVISGVQSDISDLQTGKQDVGDYALANHDHGYPNFLTKIGFNAALNVPSIANPDGISSNGITAIGFSACLANTTGWQNTGIGNVALLSNTTGEANTGLGSLSLQFTTTGSWNTASGIGSLRNNTTGKENSAFGSVAMYNNTTGSNNTAYGQAALWKNTVGSNNIAIGFAAEVNGTNYNNCIIIGTNALAQRSGDFVLGSSSNAIAVSSTVGTAGTASSLPSNPLGYLEVRLNGTLVKIPYYRV